MALKLGHVAVSTLTFPGGVVLSGPGTIRYRTGSLTNAQLKALRATPAPLVAAPGAGKLLHMVRGLLVLNAGTNALTESADNLDWRYAGATAIASSEMTGFIDQTVDQALWVVPPNDKLVTKANSENKG